MLLIVVLIFGTKKLKNIGSDLGGAVKGFKDGMRDGTARAGRSGVAAKQVSNAAHASIPTRSTSKRRPSRKGLTRAAAATRSP